MKTSSSLLLIAALSPATLLLPGCAKPDAVASADTAPKTVATDVSAEVKPAAPDSWASLKNYSFEKREDLATSLDRMGQIFDEGLAATNAKMKQLPDDAKQTRAAAITEYNAASTAFKAQLANLRSATAETWDATKTRTGVAWQRVRTAYDKLST